MMTVHAVPAWQLQIGWNVLPNEAAHRGASRASASRVSPRQRSPNSPSGQIEHYLAADTVLVEDNPR